MLQWKTVPELEGTLHYYPFIGPPMTRVAGNRYDELLDDHGPQDVLVLSRFPSGLEEIRGELQDVADTIREPPVYALSGHARTALGRMKDPPRVLSETERTALVHDLVRSHDWAKTTAYLEAAAGRDGFVDDVRRFITEASWQGIPVESSNEDLDALGELLSTYRDRLASLGVIGAPDLIQYVTRSYQRSSESSVGNTGPDAEDTDLDAPLFDSDPRTGFDAVLVLDFEEFTPIDRAYLSYLSADAELVCIASADSCIQRLWNESGRITDVTDLTVENHTSLGDVRSTTDAIASYLATNDHTEPRDGPSSAYRISASTFREQVQAVGSEIEQLVNGRYGYDEIAVVLRDSMAPIEEVIDGLWEMGIPVDSNTVAAMEHDPTARELYHVAAILRDLPDHGDVTRVVDPRAITLDSLVETTEERDRAPLPSFAPDRSDLGQRLNRLVARIDTEVDLGSEDAESTAEGERVPLIFEEVCEVLGDAAAADELDTALRTWMTRTQLTHRIARDEGKREARNQFDDIERVLELAEFHERTPSLGTSWDAFVRALSDEIERTGTDRVPTESTTREGTVTVDATRAFKNDSKRIVFVLDLVEGEFPAPPVFNRLFPTQRMESLDGYPALTHPSSEAVRSTFSTETEADRINSPQRAYYYALHRRFLATAAKTATDRLYLCTYDRERGILGETRQPSRFLRLLEREFDEISTPEQRTIQTRGEAVSYVLTRFDRALSTSRRNVAVGEEIDLEAIEREFRISGTLLDEIDDPTLEAAIRTQIAHAKGEVIRSD